MPSRSGVPSDVRGAVAPRLTVYARISINSIIHCRPAPTNSNFPFDLRSRQVAEPNRTRGRKKKLHERNEKRKNRCCALGGDVRIGVGTAEQKQAPRDARRGYRRRRPAFSLVRSDRRRLGCSNLGRGRRDRFGGALPGRLRGRTKPRFFLFWHRVRHHGGPEARVHRGQGTRM